MKAFIATALSPNHGCITASSNLSSVPIEDSLRRQVLSQMPIFEVQSMIDALYHFTHPRLDLTEALGRIPASANLGACLDVINGDPTPGTPVWMYWCTGSVAQQWSNDRRAQTVRNTAFDKCLEVKPALTLSLPFGGTVIIDNRTPGATPVIADCITPPPARQQWSYDPETGVLRSSLGTVLEVQGDGVQPTNSVLLGDFNGGPQQKWHADVTATFCSSQCNPSCTSSCAGAGPATAQCMGNCMASCISSCMIVN